MSRKQKQTQQQDTIVRFEPKNEAQRRAKAAFETHDVLFLVGPAGGGKTATAIALALQHAVPRRQTVAVCRPAVEASAGLGYLPGELNQKYAVWMSPVLECAKRFILGDPAPHLEACPLPYLRGKTFDGAAILDEAQNCTVAEILLFLTRLGTGGKLLIAGDVMQADIPDSGLDPWMKSLRGVARVGRIWFSEDNNLRHPLVREVVKRVPKPR